MNKETYMVQAKKDLRTQGRIILMEMKTLIIIGGENYKRLQIQLIRESKKKIVLTIVTKNNIKKTPNNVGNDYVRRQVN